MKMKMKTEAESTPKQKFWRRRNWEKRRLHSVVFSYTSPIFTLWEQDKVRQIAELRNELLKNWEKNNDIIKRQKADELVL